MARFGVGDWLAFETDGKPLIGSVVSVSAGMGGAKTEYCTTAGVVGEESVKEVLVYSRQPAVTWV